MEQIQELQLLTKKALVGDVGIRVQKGLICIAGVMSRLGLIFTNGKSGQITTRMLA